MGKKKTRDQAYRAAALEAALDAVAKSVRASGSATVDVPPEEVLVYAKFILGEEGSGTRWALREEAVAPSAPYPAFTAEAGVPLPTTFPPAPESGWTPLGFLTEDGLKEDPSFSVADALRNLPGPVIDGPPTLAKATLEKFAEKVRDGALAADPEPASTFRTVGEDPGDRDVLLAWTEEVKRRNAEQEAAMEGERLERLAAVPAEQWETREGATEAALEVLDDGRSFWRSARPDLNGGDSLEVKNEEDGATVVRLDANSSPEEKRKAEEVLGLVSGALDEELTITSEGTFLPGGEPAEKARAEAKEPEDRRKAHRPAKDPLTLPEYVVREGARLGCAECAAEAERREKRDAALKRGREKLHERRRSEGDGTGRDPLGVPLDDDEILAVAGRELYPASDEEPPRELLIRNRRGDVRRWTSGGYNPTGEPAGWAPIRGDRWALRYAWTSLEMDRRGPWHIV